MPRATNKSHEPGGAYSRECPECKIVFRTDNHRLIYCSIECQKSAQNRRYYERHQEKIKERARQYQRDQRQADAD